VLDLTLVKFGMTGTNSLVASTGESACISLACDEGVNRADMPGTPTSMRKNMLLFWTSLDGGILLGAGGW
jgi:hypothetical protein